MKMSFGTDNLFCYLVYCLIAKTTNFASVAPSQGPGGDAAAGQNFLSSLASFNKYMLTLLIPEVCPSRLLFVNLLKTLSCDWMRFSVRMGLFVS